MKKLINKITRRKKQEQAPTKITADTVAEHRERILAGGRRFKYPIQYERHKLVINAILIGLATLVLAIIVGWWQLYPQQNTSEFMYRLTKVLPVSVAKVDGQDVLYSDYLMKYRSSVHYLEQKEQFDSSAKDSKSRIEYIKQQSMLESIKDAYATKLAKELNLTITDSELADFLKSQRQTSDGEISTQTYDSVILDYYNWTPSEYRDVTKVKLLRQKVSYKIDKVATSSINKASDILNKNSGADFKSIVSQLGSGAANYGSSGWVPKTNQDGGLALAASKLSKNQISSVIQSTNGSGYYIVRLLDINTTKVSYEYIQVPLKTFDEQFKKIKNENKISIYISVKI